MTKGTSEAVVRQAIRDTGLSVGWYKPPDDARNPKPADYLLWVNNTGLNFGAFVEVKDCPQLRGFPLADLRPSQRLWIAQAKKLKIPYFLVVHWKRTRDWTISDAIKLLDWEQEETITRAKRPTSVPRDLMQTRYGVHTEGRLLASTLKLALLGEL